MWTLQLSQMWWLTRNLSNGVVGSFTYTVKSTTQLRTKQCCMGLIKLNSFQDCPARRGTGHYNQDTWTLRQASYRHTMQKVVPSTKNSLYCCWNHCKHHGLYTFTQSQSMAFHCFLDRVKHTEVTRWKIWAVGSSVQHLPAEAQHVDESICTTKGTNAVVQHHVLIAMSASFNLWHTQLLGAPSKPIIMASCNWITMDPLKL